jgi:4-amino-4-deoxy-L-arabinose transferase-like glycosyltransferase
MSLFSRIKNSPDRASMAVLGATLLLHLLVMGGIDLGVDEAHYALYGLHLDWSYFDHPPMVGWLQALVLLFSDSEFALRLWPLLLTVLATWLLYRLTAELFPKAPNWTPFVAVVLLHSALMFQLLGIAMVPEVPLLVAGLAATLFLWRAVQQNRWRDWLLLGVMMGLAGLSKYTAVTLAFGAALFLLWHVGWRSLLNPRLWGAAVVAMLLVLPVFYWNAQHDWISFAYQLGHGLPERAWSLHRFALALAGQFLTYGPGVVIFGSAAVFAFVRRGEASGRLLLAMILPLFLLLLWGAGLEETLPHWSLLGWVLSMPMAAVWISERLERGWLRNTAAVSVVYSVLFVLLAHLMLFTPQSVPFSPLKHPLGDMLGWREAAQRAHALQRQYPGSVIYMGNWATASRIAWYARPATVKVADERYDQFDLWYGSPSATDTALLIVPDYLQGRDTLNGIGRFAHCTQQDQFEYMMANKPVHQFNYYLCRGYHG